MTDSEDKFAEKHTGKAFSVFDEEIIAYISKQYKHLKVCFWDGELPEIDPSDLRQHTTYAKKIYDLYTKLGSRANIRWKNLAAPGADMVQEWFDEQQESIKDSLRSEAERESECVWVMKGREDAGDEGSSPSRGSADPGRRVQHGAWRAPALPDDVVGVPVVLDGCGGKGHRLP